MPTFIYARNKADRKMLVWQTMEADPMAARDQVVQHLRQPKQPKVVGAILSLYVNPNPPKKVPRAPRPSVQADAGGDTKA